MEFWQNLGKRLANIVRRGEPPALSPVAAPTRNPVSTASTEEYEQFLMAVLQATADSNDDPSVVYPLLQQNLDKLDLGLIEFIEVWVIEHIDEHRWCSVETGAPTNQSINQ